MRMGKVKEGPWPKRRRWGQWFQRHLPPSSLDKVWQHLFKKWNFFPFPASTLAHK